EVIGNKYIYLFLKNAILKQKCKYMYGYKFNESRMLKQKIMLPVNLKGEPDYQYMEDYMKYLEQKKLLEYLEYIK
ncbi:MAG: restriction endonuclease, partial [bacterium]|nr:restriction endonuclease [bacterium]